MPRRNFAIAISVIEKRVLNTNNLAVEFGTIWTYFFIVGRVPHETLHHSALRPCLAIRPIRRAIAFGLGYESRAPFIRKAVHAVHCIREFGKICATLLRELLA